MKYFLLIVLFKKPYVSNKDAAELLYVKVCGGISNEQVSVAFGKSEKSKIHNLIVILSVLTLLKQSFSVFNSLFLS